MKKNSWRWRDGEAAPRTFAALFGALLGLALLKFGNPIILEKFVTPPTNFYDWMISPWSLAIGYWLLVPVAIIGFFIARWKINAPKWLLALPAIWLGWQFVSATATVDASLTRTVLVHFTTCVVCFYLGYFSLNRLKEHRPFWLGVLGAFIVVLAVGLRQHFGGLAESREYFLTYIYPQLKNVAPDFQKKMASDRIFSTLFYPNNLAGILLLLLPTTLVIFWKNEDWPTAVRRTIVGITGVAALGCLFWSGSKGGWLLMLVLGLIALLQLPFQKKIKFALLAAMLILGLAGFVLKYSAYFEKGATSVGARFDYWRAAVETVEANPVLGSGPGTFGIVYAKIKRPESEMSRMTHNDYLEQASDSGLPGFVVYFSFFGWALIWSWRKLAANPNPRLFAVWLGLLGWSLQELFEFGLYIPATAWIAFALLGWLLNRVGNEFDKKIPAR
ncbi:MAG TPA: O-antigen ligase family protein [Verrucomicrobiae bacterium]|nr:O-antigen ligase family protein [Verrucomicrobiae bacterium]